MTEVDWSKPLTPELEALMKLKYEDENPTGLLLIFIIFKKISNLFDFNLLNV